MFAKIISLFAKPVTPETIRAELAKVTAKRLRAQKKAFSPSFGSALYKPSKRLEALKKREAELRAML